MIPLDRDSNSCVARWPRNKGLTTNFTRAYSLISKPARRASEGLTAIERPALALITRSPRWRDLKLRFLAFCGCSPPTSRRWGRNVKQVSQSVKERNFKTGASGALQGVLLLNGWDGVQFRRDHSEAASLFPARPPTTNVIAQINIAQSLLSGPLSRSGRRSTISSSKIRRNRITGKALPAKVRL